MPNHVVIASGAVVAVSVAVATAIAIYESPEVRRYADDVRRRIALALNNISEPQYRQPRYNRPEDADGFLEPGHGESNDAEIGVVDADEESRRKQREELMYWNSMHVEKQGKVNLELAEKLKARSRSSGSSFDDFLHQDEGAERGTFVFNSGADARTGGEGLRNRADGARGFSSLYANPFADEHQIDSRELDGVTGSRTAPVKDEFSDIYSATTQDDDEKRAADVKRPAGINRVPTALIGTVIQPVPIRPSPALVDVDPVPSSPSALSSATLERELGPDEFVTAGQDDRNDEAYASIQAWAQNSSQNFYSPLPVTPTATISEPELISDGQLTPTDSISVIGSGEHLATNDAQSPRQGETGTDYDVMSESDGMLTPASWSEVGSVISESDAPIPARP